MRFTGLVLALMLAAGAAAAQTFPSQRLNIVVPFPAGSVPDTMTRVVADHMQTTLGQPIVVDNRPGAGGALGAAAGARLPADGYHITMMGSPAVLAMETMKNPGFDLAKDFAPVGRLNNLINVFAVHQKTGIKTVAELIDYAKKNPGKLNYASSGPATPSDFGARLFAKKHGIEWTVVAYRGSTPATQALVAGEADVSIIPAGVALPHFRSGSVTPLAIAGPSRWSELPDVPNADEAKTQVYVDGWIGFMVPTGTPADRIRVLNEAMNKALAQENVKQAAVRTGGTVLPGTPEDLTKLIQADWASAREMVAAAGVEKQ